MAFIKVQRLVLDEDGKVVSGSAAIMDVVYVKDGKYHSKQVQREKLGKIVSLEPSRRRGVFMSPTRGLIGYDVDQDRFFDPGSLPAEGEPAGEGAAEGARSKAAGKASRDAAEPDRHKVFGDTYLALEAMRASGALVRIRRAIKDDAVYESAVARVMHAIASDGSRISLASLVDRSFVSGVFSASAVRGETFYRDLGSSASERTVSEALRTGRVPFFTDATEYGGPRLMIEFDGVGGKPVGCDPIVDPSRWPLDHDGDGVAILGEAYVTEALFKAFGPESRMTFIAAMPSKKGFPVKELCQKALKHTEDKECIFEKDGRELFAMRKKVDLYGRKAYAYVVSDMGRFGTPSPTFQVLVSNKSGSPDLVAEAYASGVGVESGCRREGGFDMPIQELCGRALCDFISRFAEEQVRGFLETSGVSPSEALGAAQSVMCAMGGEISVEKPSASVRRIFKALGIAIPERLSAKEYREGLMSPAEE